MVSFLCLSPLDAQLARWADEVCVVMEATDPGAGGGVVVGGAEGHGVPDEPGDPNGPEGHQDLGSAGEAGAAETEALEPAQALPHSGTWWRHYALARWISHARAQWATRFQGLAYVLHQDSGGHVLLCVEGPGSQLLNLYII